MGKALETSSSPKTASRGIGNQELSNKALTSSHVSQGLAQFGWKYYRNHLAPRVWHWLKTQLSSECAGCRWVSRKGKGVKYVWMWQLFSAGPQGYNWTRRRCLTCWLACGVCCGKNRRLLVRTNSSWSELRRSFPHLTRDSAIEMRLRTVLFFT